MNLDKVLEIINIYILLFIPTWVIALGAFINFVLYLIRSYYKIGFFRREMLVVRAMSMFLWALFFVVISINNTLGLFLTLSSQALIRFALFWELNVAFIYNLYAICHVRRIIGIGSIKSTKIGET